MRDAQWYFVDDMTVAIDQGAPNPLFVDGMPVLDHVVAVGSSQSGRMLRDFVYRCGPAIGVAAMPRPDVRKRAAFGTRAFPNSNASVSSASSPRLIVAATP